MTLWKSQTELSKSPIISGQWVGGWGGECMRACQRVSLTAFLRQLGHGRQLTDVGHNLWKRWNYSDIADGGTQKEKRSRPHGWRNAKWRSGSMVTPSLKNNQGFYSLSRQTSDCKISLSLEATRFRFRLFHLFWNLPGISAAALPKCLSNITPNLAASKDLAVRRLTA